MLNQDRENADKKKESLKRIQRDLLDPIDAGEYSPEEVYQAIDRAQEKFLKAIRWCN